MAKRKSQWCVQSGPFLFDLKTKMSLPRNFLFPTAHPGINERDEDTVGNTGAAAQAILACNLPLLLH